MQQDQSYEMVFDNPQDEAAYALLPGYALGIATRDEARAVEALLARYPALADELNAYRRLSERMAVETPPVEPPAGAWERIVGQLEDAAPVTPERGPLSRLYEVFVAPRLSLSPILAAVLLSVFVGVVGLLASEHARLRALHTQLEQAHVQQETALALMRARDVGWVRMNHPDDPDSSPSFAWLVYSPDDRAGVILASGFPAPEPEMTYQLWARNDAERVSLGLFDVGSDGSGAITFELPDDISRFTSMGITLEPQGGSSAPTSPAVVRLDLQEFVERLDRRS